MKEISGMMIYYYFVCKRKLWYFSNEIRMESGNDNVAFGKLLDENSYCREDKHINIDNVINIDYISETRVLHEVKKSKSIEQAGIWQLKYYLYYLKQRGVDGLSGRIDYPLIHKNELVNLSEEDCLTLQNVIAEIYEIISQDTVPTQEKMNICKKCAYVDLCMI